MTAAPHTPGTPEAIAYALMSKVMDAEDMKTNKGEHTPNHAGRADRAYLLDLYAECLEAVKGDRGKQQPRRGSIKLRA